MIIWYWLKIKMRLGWIIEFCEPLDHRSDRHREDDRSRFVVPSYPAFVFHWHVRCQCPHTFRSHKKPMYFDINGISHPILPHIRSCHNNCSSHHHTNSPHHSHASSLLVNFSQTNSQWFNLVLNEFFILVLKFLKIKIIFSFGFWDWVYFFLKKTYKLKINKMRQSFYFILFYYKIMMVTKVTRLVMLIMTIRQ